MAGGIVNVAHGEDRNLVSEFKGVGDGGKLDIKVGGRDEADVPDLGRENPHELKIGGISADTIMTESGVFSARGSLTSVEPRMSPKSAAALITPAGSSKKLATATARGLLDVPTQFSEV